VSLRLVVWMLLSRQTKFCRVEGEGEGIFIDRWLVCYLPEIMTPPNPISQSSLPDWPCTHLSGFRTGGSGGHLLTKIKVCRAHIHVVHGGCGGN
jgi:hypothetical protein